MECPDTIKDLAEELALLQYTLDNFIEILEASDKPMSSINLDAERYALEGHIQDAENELEEAQDYRRSS